MSREPGDDDDVDDGPMVALGDGLAAIAVERDAAAREAAQHVLRSSTAPPHDMPTERACLGGLLRSAAAFDAVDEEGLLAAHFYRPAHGVIFDAMQALRASGDPVDSITLTTALDKAGRLDAVGGAAAVGQLEASMATSAHVPAYAREIMEMARLRAVIKTCTDAVADCYAQSKKAVDVVDAAQRNLSKLSTGALRPRHIRDIMRSLSTDLEKGVAGVRKMPTGIKPIDDGLKGGMPHGLMTVWALATGIGKSSLMRLLLKHVCGVNGVPSLLFTPEMTARQTGGELVEHESGIHLPASFVDVSISESTHLQASMGDIAEWPLHIEDSKVTVEDFRAVVRRAVREDGVQFVGIDYLGDMRLSTHTPKRPDMDWIHVCEGIKDVAKELDIVVAAMSQINPPGSWRDKSVGEWPQIPDLPLTQQFGKDAGATIFGVRHPNSADLKDVTKLMLRGKNRFGKGGTAEAYLRYSAETTQLIEVDGTGFLADGGGDVIQRARKKPRKPPAFGADNPRDPTDHDSRL